MFTPSRLATTYTLPKQLMQDLEFDFFKIMNIYVVTEE